MKLQTSSRGFDSPHLCVNLRPNLIDNIPYMTKIPMQENYDTLILLTKYETNFYTETQPQVLYTNLIIFISTIYIIGLLGLIYNRKNFFIAMMGVELMFLAIILGFIIVSLFTSNPEGQIYALFILV